MNLKGKMLLEDTGSLFLSSGGSSRNKRKSSIGVASVASVASVAEVVDSSVVGVASIAGVAEVVASVAEVVEGIGVGSVVQTGVGDGRSGNEGSSDERGRGGDDVDGSGSLLGGKTSGSGVIESSLEGSLGSGDILDVIQVGGADLSSLNIVVDGVEGVRPEGGVLPSLGSCKGSVEGLLGSGHLDGVLKGSGGGQRQERAESQLGVHVECCSGESSAIGHLDGVLKG